MHSYMQCPIDPGLPPTTTRAVLFSFARCVTTSWLNKRSGEHCPSSKTGITMNAARPTHDNPASAEVKRPYLMERKKERVVEREKEKNTALGMHQQPATAITQYCINTTGGPSEMHPLLLSLSLSFSLSLSSLLFVRTERRPSMTPRAAAFGTGSSKRETRPAPPATRNVTVFVVIENSGVGAREEKTSVCVCLFVSSHLSSHIDITNTVNTPPSLLI